MLLSVFGTPSFSTLRVVGAVRALANVALGGHRFVGAATAEELRKAWSDEGNQSTVLFGDIPDAEICRLMRQSGAPILVVLDPPADIVAAAMQRFGTDLRESVRASAKSLSAIHDLAFCPTSFCIGPSSSGAAAEDLAATISRAFGIALEPQKWRRVVELIQKADATPPKLSPKAQPTTDVGSAPEIPALGGFDEVMAGRPASAFVWPTVTFMTAEPLGEPLYGPVTMTGGRRCLIYGPYLHLPAGQWTAELEIEVWENTSGNVLKIDVHTDRVIWEAGAPLPEAGRFKCRVPVNVDEPRLPIQIRLFVDEGALEGRLALHHVTIARDRPGAAPPPPPVRKSGT
ncbi:MAG: hypothetical protein R3D44_11125 [Hyphomicrobiaceae bacterium]